MSGDALEEERGGNGRLAGASGGKGVEGVGNLVKGKAMGSLLR